MTSDPADRLVLSFYLPPLSLFFTSLKECRGGYKKKKKEKAEIMKPVLEGERWKREKTRKKRGQARGDK